MSAREKKGAPLTHCSHTPAVDEPDFAHVRAYDNTYVLLVDSAEEAREANANTGNDIRICRIL